ncbi:MAG: hypothetical protein AAF684_07355 [Pseudomonadota bacterium]
MFVALPIQFNVPGRINLDQVERYWKEDISHQAKRPFQMSVKFVSGVVFIADFDNATERDGVYNHMDRFFTNKDKSPLYDTEDW